MPYSPACQVISDKHRQGVVHERPYDPDDAKYRILLCAGYVVQIDAK